MSTAVPVPSHATGQWIDSKVASRLDRLPWSGWHWLVIVALGITWLLDGLEVTLAGALAGVLQSPRTLGLSDAEIGLSGTFYLIGAVTGAVVFGYLTDRLGRKKLFTVTLLLYLTATALTAFSWNFWSYVFFRAMTGAGIGGEYSAINSAVDELIPARVRGYADLLINSTYWIGAAIGAVASIALLGAKSIPESMGWRYVFFLGAGLGLIILFLRQFLPESPRWLVVHGRNDEAEKIVTDIENKVTHHHPEQLPAAEGTIRIQQRTHTPWSEIWQTMLIEHRTRSILGLVLMSTQAFFYNAIFFTYALVLVTFFGVPPTQVGWYLLPFALGNFVGPLTIGRLFDSIGRKPMITATYALSGILLAVSGWMFQQGWLTAQTQAICWTVIFFVASSAASAAYLTVSEIFPLEIRGMAIAVFYALGTFSGGVGAPLLFSRLIATHSRTMLFYGYLGGAALMIFAAIVESLIGVKAERMSLEHITAPLSSRDSQVRARHSDSH